MKVYSKMVEIKTYGPMVLHPVTNFMMKAVTESGTKFGLLWASVEGATPALLVLSRGFDRAFIDFISKLVLFRSWRHGNAYAHLISSIISTNIVIPIVDGSLALSRDEEVYLLETRSVYNHTRRVAIQVHGT